MTLAPKPIPSPAQSIAAAWRRSPEENQSRVTRLAHRLEEESDRLDDGPSSLAYLTCVAAPACLLLKVATDAVPPQSPWRAVTAMSAVVYGASAGMGFYELRANDYYRAKLEYAAAVHWADDPAAKAAEVGLLGHVLIRGATRVALIGTTLGVLPTLFATAGGALFTPGTSMHTAATVAGAVQGVALGVGLALWTGQKCSELACGLPFVED